MADLLTGIRLLLAAPTAWALYAGDLVSGIVLVGIVVVVILTDLLDGPVARSLGTASARGQLFDHGSDFVFVTACLFGAAGAGMVTIVLPILIVVAFSQYVFDSYIVHRRKALKMSTLGRMNGVLYFVPVVMAAVSRIDGGNALGGWVPEATHVVAYLLVASTIASIVDRALAPVAEGAVQPDVG